MYNANVIFILFLPVSAPPAVFHIEKHNNLYYFLLNYTTSALFKIVNFVF